MNLKDMEAIVARIADLTNEPGLHLETRHGATYGKYRYRLMVTMLPGTGVRYYDSSRYMTKQQMEAYLTGLWRGLTIAGATS